jgi:hypothetical protein
LQLHNVVYLRQKYPYGITAILPHHYLCVKKPHFTYMQNGLPLWTAHR